MPIESWADVTVSVQLPPTWLAAGRMPSLAPGDVRELTPAVYTAEYVPVLDPRLERGGRLGPTGDRCRATWRVSGLRRFPMVGGETRDAVTLDRTPDPWDVEVESTYVVDLVPADRD